MCGIWGALSTVKITHSKNLLLNKFYSIKHRGFDETIFIDGSNYIIGHHKSIFSSTGTSTRHQPLSFVQTHGSITRTTYLSVDGLIDNWNRFQDKTLVEFGKNINYGNIYFVHDVLMLMFLSYGMESMLEKLDGSFAISIFDFYKNNETGDLSQHLWIGRDRFGMKPLFYTELDDGQTVYFGSEMKSLTDINSNTVLQIDPRTLYHWSFDVHTSLHFEKKIYWAVGSLPLVLNPYPQDVYETTRRLLTESILGCLSTDFQIGCVLTGNIASGLIASIASEELKKTNRVLRTFSAGDENSLSVQCAYRISKYIGSSHTNFTFENNKLFDCVESAIKIGETFDVRTVRTLIVQQLLCEKIANTTDVKVLLVADGADEVMGGYSYFKNAPDPYSLHFESKRLLHWIHYYDVLGIERTCTLNGLIVHMPYLSRKFVEFYFQIDPKLRVPMMGASSNPEYKYGKYLLRKSFEKTNILPINILWDRMGDFSDGFEVRMDFEDYTNTMYSDEYFETKRVMFDGPGPMSETKEGLWYREIYEKYFPSQHQNTPYYWNSKWKNQELNTCTDVYKICSNSNMGIVKK